jgi:hypothetical protein
MKKRKIISFDYFPSFQEKDAFYEKITHEKDAPSIILTQFLLLFLFSFLYGIVMGIYNGWLQAVTAGFKVPILFILSIIICFPAFFMVQYILGSKLKFYSMMAIILTGFVLTSAIMLSFSPIVIFFLITSKNYDFLKLLHVAIIGFAGIFGMRTVVEALKFSCEKKNVYPKIGVKIFQFWIFILAFVGMQLAWNLRPFIGAKDLPYQFFRKQESNFYLAVLQSTGRLLNLLDQRRPMEQEQENRGPQKETVQDEKLKKEENAAKK